MTSSVLWQGNTALMLAVKQGDFEVAEALLGAKANMEALNVIPIPDHVFV